MLSVINSKLIFPLRTEESKQTEKSKLYNECAWFNIVLLLKHSFKISYYYSRGWAFLSLIETLSQHTRVTFLNSPAHPDWHDPILTFICHVWHPALEAPHQQQLWSLTLVFPKATAPKLHWDCYIWKNYPKLYSILYPPLKS